MFKNITLELSLKPFKHTDDAYIRGVCERIFDDWRPLLSGRESISVMLWCADGSEILDYDRNPDSQFEWCKYLGTANKPLLSDEERHTSIHDKKQPYISDPPVMTYRVLKRIVATVKAVGKERYPDAKIRVGETFDIGPEFAVSSFKYERHREICEGSATVDHLGFVDSTALLHADTRTYAAYPDGIPEGLPFARFLGKQANIFLRDMGFDYIWLSNGLGFSANPWQITGKIFDGESYHPEKLERVSKQVFSFWKTFREECPDIPIETRGTNNTAGIDYASDGVPLHDIYNAGLGITPPPNSPWAAINKNYGLEIVGHMSRCCELPADVFPFRYYLHDPWWINSPWYDRYEGAPTDIYLPMAISRIDGEGRIGTANSLNILSIDNSFGDMPAACVSEPLPHLLKAEKNAPDAIAPVVWIYPLREFTHASGEMMLREMHEGDRFVCSAVNASFPLCCVSSTDSFLKHDLSIYKGSVLLCPAVIFEAVKDKVARFVQSGGSAIFYGTATACENIPDCEGIRTVRISEGADRLRHALGELGYKLEPVMREGVTAAPVCTVSRYDNAYMLSIYNPNATTDMLMRFPLGAPVMIGSEVEIKCGCALYRLPRFTYGECRLLVEQEGGIVECCEMPPVNRRYRRKLAIKGLKGATVRFFCESGVDDVIICDRSTHDPIDGTPIALENTLVKVKDEKYGEYYEARGLDGEYVIAIGYRK